PHAGAWIETLYMRCNLRLTTVAPHAGAWIETVRLSRDRPLSGSRPTRARGLKPLYARPRRRRPRVAPHAGAWIETNSSPNLPPSSAVAPHAGAWIETMRSRSMRFMLLSRPTRARGLKPAGMRPQNGA